MPIPAPEALIVERLTIERGGRTVLADLSFNVTAGEALVLTGPNGAGKTTLLRALAGLIPATAGTIRLDGLALDAPIGEHCHLVGHLDAVKPHLSVAENARFWTCYLGNGGADESEIAQAALARLGLAGLANFPAGYLSAGQRRRLGLARLLLAPRPLWLLDEPTVSLDTSSRDKLAAIIEEHIANAGMVVAATHMPLGLARARELPLAIRSRAA